MTLPAYPLERVLEIKKRRVRDAEKVVQQKEKALQVELDKLATAVANRDRAKKHKEDKLQQLRDEMDHVTSSPKIQQMKAYLKICEEKLKIEEKKVADQKEQVKIAEKNLAEAKEVLRQKRVEVDKVETHKGSWTKEILEEIKFEEERELDETGSILHQMRKRRGY